MRKVIGLIAVVVATGAPLFAASAAVGSVSTVNETEQIAHIDQSTRSKNITATPATGLRPGARGNFTATYQNATASTGSITYVVLGYTGPGGDELDCKFTYTTTIVNGGCQVQLTADTLVGGGNCSAKILTSNPSTCDFTGEAQIGP